MLQLLPGRALRLLTCYTMLSPPDRVDNGRSGQPASSEKASSGTT